jgi:PBP1b-binding outer membrane lipoprotein LpoB
LNLSETTQEEVTMRTRLIALLAMLALVSGCAQKQFTEGKYDDMSEDRLLDDKFNESDMRQIADTMIQSLVGSVVIQERKKPGRTTDESGATVRVFANPGSVLEFKYLP